MSTPNPTHIDVGAMALLDALRNDETNWLNQRRWDPVTARLHFEHVVSKLTDAGYSIVPTPRGHSPECIFTGNRCHTCVCGTGVDPQFGNIGPHTQGPNLKPGCHDHTLPGGGQ